MAEISDHFHEATDGSGRRRHRPTGLEAVVDGTSHIEGET
ncbi:hypothetical protein HAPAU_26240 [Halalkalicoccus paucihalophilus]|uniref:Uncharacterized protein n=1 Tax=Halalkalicoccus paucihalophilus TaxID=1008153 RepID=A0A151AE94_9EURY|nr:hypothetical protein HAPAU_26240 [Halalkalicoccus paucihalophilus]